MNVHVVDGTYELFRYFYAPNPASGGPQAPPPPAAASEDLRAVRGVVSSLLGMLYGGATHVGVATDRVIESFRNELFGGYKTGEGIDPRLFAQFGELESALESLGLAVWPMVELEADDALASAALVAELDPRVDKVYVCSPDKDLAQCVRGERVVQLSRRTNEIRDEAGVIAKFGVPPSSIPDWLALVGDSADGYPGIPGWGAKSAAKVLARYGTLDAIPESAAEWDVNLRGASSLAAALRERREDALLFRTLARLRTDAAVGTVDDWKWKGPRADFTATAARLGDPQLAERAAHLVARRFAPAAG